VIALWPCPDGDGLVSEAALAFDRSRAHRLLIVPPLLEEMNRTRRLLVETMRRLDAAGIDSMLPDLPGCNDSLQTFEAQSLSNWRSAMTQAAQHFDVTHVLAIRGGALVFPQALPGWLYEPAKGASLLRQLLRARIIAAREQGLSEDSAGLLEQGRESGLELAGYRLGAALIAELEEAVPPATGPREIRQSELEGGALWLRSEPDESPQQADALAQIIAREIAI
jgi:hypothetical protein